MSSMKGYIRKRGSKYSFTVDIGRDPITGKRRQKTKGGFKTKKEAQSALAKFIAEIEEHGYNEPTKTTFVQFAEDFLETQVKPNLRKSTVYNYERTINLLKEHPIGNMEISKITALHVQNFLKHLQDKGYKNGTTKVFFSCTKAMLKRAFEWGLIKQNPALVKVPKPDKGSDRSWTYEEAMYFLEKVKDESYYLIYLLTLFTGLRRGEVLGIPEKNVDFKNNTITISQQVIAVNGQAELTKRLKTSSSYRTIEVPQFIMEQLKTHIKDQKKKLLQLGVPNVHNLVFVTSNGNYIHPYNVNAHFRKMCDRYGLPRIPFHGLRHTHATILAEFGTNVHAIADRLGHSSPTITNEMYIHLSKKMNQKLLDHLELMSKSLNG
jgi:integrase